MNYSRGLTRVYLVLWVIWVFVVLAGIPMYIVGEGLECVWVLHRDLFWTCFKGGTYSSVYKEMLRLWPFLVGALVAVPVVVYGLAYGIIATVRWLGGGFKTSTRHVPTPRKESTVNGEPLGSPSQDSQVTQPVPPQRHRWLLFLTPGLLALLVVALVFQTISLRRLSYRVTMLELDSDIRESKTWLGSEVRPESNTIQFLDRGYSIQFEQVAYEPAGLHLIGYLGNPTNLLLHSIGLKFSARKVLSLQDYRKMLGEYRKERKSIWSDWDLLHLVIEPEEIGSAQSPAIDIILPGSTGRFDVTIPNVRQTKEGFTLYVSIKGERYSYAR